jgi:hypothetical protein
MSAEKVSVSFVIGSLWRFGVRVRAGVQLPRKEVLEG